MVTLSIPSTEAHRKRWLDYVLVFSKIIAILGMAISGISLFVSGGGPEIIDDKFCVINHGEMIRIISEKMVHIFICLRNLNVFLRNVNLYNVNV